MAITDQTIDQLRAATKAQIITAIDNKLNNLTKKQLIELVFDYVQVFNDPPIRTFRVDGQPLTLLEAEKDAVGTKLSSRRVRWTYYGEKAGAPVDTITIEQLDAADKVTATKRIKHALDGSQPTVSLS